VKTDPEQAHRHFLTLLPRNYWLLRNLVDQRLEPMGLSSAQWRPLLVLNGADGPMTQVQLARVLGLESPTVVRLLDRLGEKGWITRRSCPGDRRAYHLELTAPARALCDQIERVLTTLRREVLMDVSPAELAQASAVMERIQARLTSLDQAAAPPAPAPRAKPGAHGASHKMRGARRPRGPGLQQ
jgi:MarR family transcriptional regulator for hemolysin